MKYAVIDMGSNSIRLMLAEVTDGQLGHVEKHLEMTRLGAGVDTTKMLSETSMQATVEAVSKFKQMADEAGAHMVGAFATSAVRDAANGAELAARIFNETGVTVEIIPGTEEAELGYRGVVSGLGDLAGAAEKFVIIDIGGGSTELIVGDVNGIQYRHSFNVGVVRMTGKHLHSDPVLASEIEALEADIRDILKDGVSAVLALKPKYAIGIGGTATTFAAMKLEMAIYDRERIHNATVTRQDLEAIVDQLAHMTVAEKKQIVGLMPKRADVIYAGGAILSYLMKALSLDVMYASDYDNLEGILVQKNILK